MSWNYRVLKFIDDPDPDKHWYAIHEMFYKDAAPADPSNPAQYAGADWTVEPSEVRGVTQLEVWEDMASHEAAFHEPVLLIKGGQVVGMEPWESRKPGKPPTRPRTKSMRTASG